MNDVWWLVFAAVLVLAGAFVLAVVVCSARLAGPDTDQRDPYRLAGRTTDAPPVDLDLALARQADVDATPDGRHDDMGVDDQRWSAELLWLYERFPEAVALDQGDDLLAAPPITPGRDAQP